MGLENSKPSQITRRVENLRDSVRRGEIALDDSSREKLREQLGSFSRQLSQRRGNKTEIDNAQKLINDVTWEIYNETSTGHDRRFTPKSSKRYDKTKSQKKSLKDIESDVERLQKQGQFASKPEADRILGELAANSQQLSIVAQSNKKKDVEKTQRLISSVSEEIIRKHLKSDTDSVQDAQSFHSRSSLRTEKQPESLKRERSKSVENLESSSRTSRRNLKVSSGNITDIEEKLKSIKSDSKTAIDNKDTSQLRFLLKSIETLMTNLQLLNEDDPIVREKQVILEKDLQRLFRKLNKSKNEMNAQNNIDYLTQLKDKKKIEDTLKHLEDLEFSLYGIDVEEVSNENNPQEIAVLKVQISDFKNQINAIDDLSVDICEKKKQLYDMIQTIERVLLKLELEYKLKAVEEAHQNCKTDLNRFSYFPDSEEFKKYNTYLHELKEYVKKIQTIDKNVEERKNNLLRGLESTGNSLKNKAEDNKRKSQKIEQHEVVLRKQISSNDTLLENLTKSIEDFTKNFNVQNHEDINELRKFQQVLDRPKKILEDKFKEISAAITKTIQDENAKRENSQSLTKIKAKLVDSPDLVQRVTIENRQSNASSNRLEEIEENVTRLQNQIQEHSFDKSSEEYKETKSQLEGHRRRLRSLCLHGDHRKSATNILKQVDGVLHSLDNIPAKQEPPRAPPKPQSHQRNLSLSNPEVHRRNTTEHILNDLMSVQSRVKELVNKITGIGSLRKEDFTNTKKKLYEHKDYLMRLDLSTYSHNICKSRDEIVSEINEHLSLLDTLPQKNYERVQSLEENKFNEECKSLKDKVSRFSGTYKNVLYRKLEEDLTRCLRNTDQIISDPNQAQRIKMDLFANLKILENKAIKDMEYVNCVDKPQDPKVAALSDIKEEVNNIKTEVYDPDVKTNKDLKVLDGRLTLQNLSLEHLNVPQGPIEQEKIILQQEIDGCLSHISHRQQTPVVKTHIEEPVIVKAEMKSSKPSALKELERIEQILEQAKVEVLSFVGLETSTQFFELDETFIQSTLTLDNLNIDQTNPLYSRKIQLLKVIQQYSEILEERVRQTEILEALENETKEMFIKVDAFDEREDYNSLDEKLINLKLKAGKFEPNQHLLVRKNLCIQQIDECMKKFNEIGRNIRGTRGTIV